MRSYSQLAAAAFTCFTILSAVIFGPDGNFTGSLMPVASILTLVPPTSMTKVFGLLLLAGFVLLAGFMNAPLECAAARPGQGRGGRRDFGPRRWWMSTRLRERYLVWGTTGMGWETGIEPATFGATD